MRSYPYLLPTLEYGELEKVASMLSEADIEVLDTGIMPGPEEEGFTLFTSRPVPLAGLKKLHLKPFE